MCLPIPLNSQSLADLTDNLQESTITVLPVEPPFRCLKK